METRSDIARRLVGLANSLGGDDEDVIMAGVAEIARLTAALQDIANMGTGERVRMARRALEPKP